MKGYNHGKLISTETRQKMSLAAKKTLNGFKKGHTTNVGHKHSLETINKLKEVARLDGRRPYQPIGYKHSKATRKKISLSKKGKVGNWLGKKRPNMKNVEYRNKVSAIMRKLVAEGKHNFWKGGITVQNKLLRTRIEYRLWRESVFKRDDWTCQECGKRGGRLQAHHIKPFSKYPELRYNIENGITLCIECHKKTDTYGHRALTVNK
jgi:hypothetical protein